MSIRHVFRKIAHATAAAIGSPYAFIGAVSVVLVWAACGPLFHFSDTWQLAINTSTTIVTFLVVFMIQNSQNRDSKAIHLKLDELICAVKSARNQLIDIEDLDDEELARLALEFRQRRRESDAEPDAPDHGERHMDDERSTHDHPGARAHRDAQDPGGALDEAGDPRRAARVAELPSDHARPGAPIRTPRVSAR